MQHDTHKQRIILTTQEGCMLGLDSVDAVQMPGEEQRVFILPDTETADLIGRIAEAESVIEAKLRDGPKSDPMVRDGLLDARQQWLELYGGLCAVRNTVENRGLSDHEQFQRLLIELGGRAADTAS